MPFGEIFLLTRMCIEANLPGQCNNILTSQFFQDKVIKCSIIKFMMKGEEKMKTTAAYEDGFV